MAMIESSAEAVITINQNGIIEEWNTAATKTFGWSKTEAIGLRLSELIIPHRYRAAHEAGMNRFLRTGETKVLNRTIELTALNSLGLEFPVELSVWPVNVEKTYWFSAFIRDISARVKAAADAEHYAKRMLRYQSTLFELARMDKSDFPVAIKFILRTVAQTLGLSYAAILDFCESKRTLSCRAMYLAEIDGMMDKKLLWTFKDVDYPNYFATILANSPIIVEDAQNDAKTIEFHDRLKNLDITSILDVPIWLDGDVVAVFWCGMTCSKRSWDAHDISFALAVANQIALSLEAVARLQAEEHLRQAAADVRKALEREQELNELKSRFIAMASHEFRTPLTTILSATEMLETYADRLDAQKKANLTEMIKGSVKNMTHLLDEVLFIGKADTGHLSFQPQPTSIDLLCREFIAEVSSSVGKKHQIIYQTPTRNSVLLVLDAFLLRQIVLNLLGNSVKFSDPGTRVILSWQLHDSTLVLTIVDQGIGIPLEDQGQLFTTFYRAKNVRNIQGTGLGLAIVKQCTELHGGEISFSSELGKGTTFSIAIPVQSG